MTRVRFLSGMFHAAFAAAAPVLRSDGRSFRTWTAHPEVSACP